MPDHTQLFAFEADFVATLRCIPMAVRLKLDTCGVKLTLRQWSRFTPADRHGLLAAPCARGMEIAAYRRTLEALVQARAGETARPLASVPLSQWDAGACPPGIVTAYAASLGLTAPTAGQ